MLARRATDRDPAPIAALNRVVHDLHVAAEPTRYRPTDDGEVVAWLAAC